MTVNNYMRILVQTLVDITETNARKSSDKVSFAQQTNYNTFLQSAGLRANIEPITCSNKALEVEDLGFGTQYEGKQRVWELLLNNPYEGAITKEMLEDDFDFIPIVTQLNETVLINNNVIRTKSNKEKNTTFTFLKY
jgi:hypothetical protein